MPFQRLLRCAPLPLLAFTMACDDGPVAASAAPPEGEPAAVVAALECRTSVAGGALSCSPIPPGAAGGARLAVIGGQGVNVQLRSTNVSYDSVTQVFRADVTVQNLMSQAMGTPDGVLVTGVRVFHSAGPTATQYYTPGDTGTVYVSNADGKGTFTAPGQPYFEYREILFTGDTSAVKTWNWHVPRTVQNFSFQVLVEATLPSETALPPVPWNEYDFPDDTLANPITPDHPSYRYYRNAAGIVFDDTATAATFSRVLQKYDGELIAGFTATKTYVVRIPDAGPTLADLVERLDSIGAEPGVRLAYPLAFWRNTTLSVRFPDDVTGLRRQNWTDTTGLTWAHQSIRAPLSWGCETGLYTSPARVRIGVMDFLFETGNQEFDSTTVHLVQPTTGLQNDAALATPVVRTHGTSVSAAMTALGNNNYGVAGMVWASDIHMFAFARGNQSVRDPLSYMVNTVLPQARANGVRVLVSAMNFGNATQAEYDLLEQEMRNYLDGDNLFVQAVGNGGGTYTAAAIDAMQASNSAATVVVAVDLVRSTHPGNILLVGGTQPATGGTTPAAAGGVERWVSATGGSDFISDATQIVAPARDVPALIHSAVNVTNDVQAVPGTSIATPLVGGVAAQLWSMDPTLTAAQVKDYILRGAQQQRRDPATGSLVNAQPVTGFPQTVYQLDSYGALTLLASERNGTPVCGFPVTVEGGKVVLQRRTGGFEQLNATGGSEYLGASVAQGGRKIAYTEVDASYNTVGVHVINHQGNLLQTVGGGVWRRVFLERDTADFTDIPGCSFTPCWNGPAITIRRHDGTVSGPINVFDKAVPTALEATTLWYSDVEVSPTGDWALARAIYVYSWDCGLGSQVNRADLVSLRNNTVHNVYTFQDDSCRSGNDPCTDCASYHTASAGWFNRGDRVLVAFPRYDFSGGWPTARRTALITANVSGTTSTSLVQNWEATLPRFTPDDHVALLYENDGSYWSPTSLCRLTTRFSRSPGTVLLSQSLATTDCEAQKVGPAPQLDRHRSASAPSPAARGGASAAGPGGSPLAGAFPRGRGGPPRGPVQVN